MSFSVENTFTRAKLQHGIWYTGAQQEVSFPKDALSHLALFEEDSFWFRHRNEVITGLASKYIGNGVIVDIGGGNGIVSKALSEAGFEPVLLEPGPEGARVAAERGIAHVICSTFQEAGISTQSIPNAGSFDVIEHVENDDQFCKDIFNSLRSGGYFISTVPALHMLWSAEDRQAGHFRRYTRKSYTELMKSCGFEVVYCSYFFALLTLPVFLLRSIPSFFGLIFRQRTASAHARDHARKPGITGRLMDWLFRHELRRILSGKQVFTGSSIIMVARKP